MQAPFGVVVEPRPSRDRMRDLVRFYFGFSVDLVAGRRRASGRSPQVARRRTTSASSPRDAGERAVVARLAGATAPRIIAMLPFIEVTDRPADLPAYVISPPLADPTPPDIRVFAVHRRGDWRKATVASFGGDRRRRPTASAWSRLPAAVDADAADARREAGVAARATSPRSAASLSRIRHRRSASPLRAASRAT